MIAMDIDNGMPPEKSPPARRACSECGELGAPHLAWCSRFPPPATGSEVLELQKSNRLVYRLTGGRFASAQEMGEALYQAYGDHAQWVRADGDAMCPWSELPTSIKEHWSATALAAATMFI